MCQCYETWYGCEDCYTSSQCYYDTVISTRKQGAKQEAELLEVYEGKIQHLGIMLQPGI
jgi:hypothetical protein